MPNNNKIISPRALVFSGAAREEAPPILAKREASHLAPGSAKCEDDASRRQRRRYVMIQSQLLPGSRRALRFGLFTFPRSCFVAARKKKPSSDTGSGLGDAISLEVVPTGKDFDVRPTSADCAAICGPSQSL